MKKRYKVLLLFFISFLLSFFIYLFVKKDNRTYVTIGYLSNINNLSTQNFGTYINYSLENRYNHFHFFEHNTIFEISNNLSTNKNDISFYIKNATFVVISLNFGDLNNYKQINTAIINDYLKNVYKIIHSVSRLNQRVYLIDLNNINVSDKIKSECQKFKVNHIGIKEIGENNIYTSNNKIMLNFIGHTKISEIIVNSLDK